MSTYAVAEAATVLGVSDDTVRRWVDAGRVASRRDQGRLVIDGPDLAALATSLVENPDPGLTRTAHVSARNRLPGIVTRVLRDTVMAQVDMVCGPYRLVSLMSAEAADDLGLEPGSRVVASVKSTNVTVETP
ncbi:TOBE domain-containing protein [Nocardioides bruguierae]|uniref:TOBE domain-containing protein n=1 Tax=Nocardioides bruguierae TaxID=2945102 RepID=A0A9X2DA90_9ACTN|nr:TOBE domain-containing protein [Nocardioides bruguierae]MCL8025782.1 TOBE domain-containing protein [Nocardioides bruguierae]MCM0622036.1 TOBE domain-containing protein [Nocardioides bruguierae]